MRVRAPSGALQKRGVGPVHAAPAHAGRRGAEVVAGGMCNDHRPTRHSQGRAAHPGWGAGGALLRSCTRYNAPARSPIPPPGCPRPPPNPTPRPPHSPHLPAARPPRVDHEVGGVRCPVCHHQPHGQQHGWDRYGATSPSSLPARRARRIPPRSGPAGDLGRKRPLWGPKSSKISRIGPPQRSRGADGGLSHRAGLDSPDPPAGSRQTRLPSAGLTPIMNLAASIVRFVAGNFMIDPRRVAATDARRGSRRPSVPARPRLARDLGTGRPP